MMVPLNLEYLGFKLALTYVASGFNYSIALASKKCLAGQIQQSNRWDTVCMNLLMGKMTYWYKSKGQDMVPTIPDEQQFLLVRKLACQYARGLLGQVSVGDVVLVRSPLDPTRFLVRRLAALGGQEMLSTKEEDETFVIEDGQCWLLADNDNLKAEEANDSRTWGPIAVDNIMGRVIYRFHNVNDHYFVHNSFENILEDRSLILFEGNFDEMEESS